MARLVVLSFAIGLIACSSSSSTTPSGSSGDGGQTGGTPAFRKDVMPLLSTNCALTACHGSSSSNLGIYLSFDPEQVYGQLKGQSATAKMAFVVPGDPKTSYLQIKIDGTQGDVAGKCGGTCGAQMPLDLPPLAQDKRDLIRAWITAGAKDD